MSLQLALLLAQGPNSFTKAERRNVVPTVWDWCWRLDLAAVAKISSCVSTIPVIPETRSVTLAFRTGLLVFLFLSCLDSLSSCLALYLQIIIFCISPDETFLSSACLLIKTSWKVLQGSLAIFSLLYISSTAPSVYINPPLRYWHEYLSSLIERFLLYSIASKNTTLDYQNTVPVVDMISMGLYFGRPWSRGVVKFRHILINFSVDLMYLCW